MPARRRDARAAPTSSLPSDLSPGVAARELDELNDACGDIFCEGEMSETSAAEKDGLPAYWEPMSACIHELEAGLRAKVSQFGPRKL